MRGIRDIRITGIIFSASILIGADTELVSIMTRIFIIGTIVARGQVGIKDSMEFVLPGLPVLACVLLEPLVLAFMVLEQLVLVFAPLGPPVLASVLLEPLVLAFMALEPPALEQLVLVFIALRLLVLVFKALEPPVLESVLLEPLVLAFLLKPLVPAVVNLGQLLLVRKNNNSSSPTGASSQIAQPGRSGIILKAKSRSPLFDHCL